MKYIDADKLKSIIRAQINERNKWLKGIDKSDRQDQLWSDLNNEDISILEIITSLQQEKVSFKKIVNAKTGRISLVPRSGEGDLEKEIDDYITSNFCESTDGILLSDANSTELQISDVSKVARYFYNLGFNARKP